MTDLHMDADGKKWERVASGDAIVGYPVNPDKRHHWTAKPVIRYGDRWVLERPLEETEGEKLAKRLVSWTDTEIAAHRYPYEENIDEVLVEAAAYIRRLERELKEARK